MNEIIETTGTEVTDVRQAEILAREINTIKSQTLRVVLQSSIDIGERLTRAKALVAHGEWEKWLADNVDYSQSTANNLMKIYREYSDNQYDLFSSKPKSEIFGELTYSQAVALFALPAHEREDFVGSHDMSDMSVSELNEEIKRLKSEKESTDKKNELLEASLAKAEEASRNITAAESDFRRLESELKDAKDALSEETTRAEDAEKRAEALTGDIEALRKALAEAEKKQKDAEPEQISIDDVPESEIEKLRSEIEKELETKYAEKEKASKAQFEATLKSEREADAAERAELNAVIEKLEADKAKLDEKSKRGESTVAVQQFAALFEAFQEDFNRMFSKLTVLESNDSEVGAKIRAALGRVVSGMSERIGE